MKPPYFARDLKNLPAAPLLYFTELEFTGWMLFAVLIGASIAAVVLTALSMGAA